jgi:hypothetical protein
MRVPDRVAEATVFIGTSYKGNFSPNGTGFFVLSELDGFHFQALVTARHVVEEIQGDEIFVRINTKGGGVKVIPTPKNLWHFHPNADKRKYVDVAVFPSNFPMAEFDIVHVPVEKEMATPEIFEKEKIGIGDEIFTVGLYTNHFGQKRNISVLRHGILSSIPAELMYTSYGYIDGYLAETRSVSGSSGSPVFLQMAPIRFLDDKATYSQGRHFYFLGVTCGHWTVKNPEDAISSSDDPGMPGEITTGMTIVVPAKYVVETLNQEYIMSMRKETVSRKKAESKFKFTSAQTPKEKHLMDETLQTMLNTPPDPKKNKKGG